jgi:hypothetical protein
MRVCGLDSLHFYIQRGVGVWSGPNRETEISREWEAEREKERGVEGREGGRREEGSSAINNARRCGIGHGVLLAWRLGDSLTHTETFRFRIPKIHHPSLFTAPRLQLFLRDFSRSDPAVQTPSSPIPFTTPPTISTHLTYQRLCTPTGSSPVNPNSSNFSLLPLKYPSYFSFGTFPPSPSPCFQIPYPHSPQTLTAP